MRQSEVERKTKETDISIKLNIDGSGIGNIDTGIGFFDHMLEAFCKHSGVDLDIKCKGDLIVDCHHTVEDVGIVLGSAIRKALGNKSGIARYGDAMIPMDEALVLCAIDLSGRSYLVFEANLSAERVGYMDSETVKEFFYALAMNGMLNLHIREISGENTHHVIEGMFKAFAHAFKKAVALSGDQTLSTKGVL